MQSFPGRAPLPERVDIVIIGGGINGVALARECAQARKSVLLVERNDFGCGASSRTNRIVPGGLRSLERGSFGMAHDSLRGRAALLREQPHLVQPLDFVLAADSASRGSGLRTRAALWLYRKLGKLPPTDSSEEVESLRRTLDPARRWTLYPYQEAQCEFPERLVADWLREACAAGAIARNHASVLSIRAAEGRVRGVILRDALTRQESYVESEWVINATGPWVDLVRDLTGLAAPRPLARTVRSCHLMLRRWPGAPSIGLYAEVRSGLQSGIQPTPRQGRSISITPWNGMLQVGSTHFSPTHFDQSSDPSLAPPSAEELEFLLNSAAALFPAARLTPAAIVFSYTGVLPIPYHRMARRIPLHDPGESLPVADFVPCRHVLHNHADEGALGLLSIFGGTLATASALAQRTARTMGLPLERLADPPLTFGESSGTESTLQQWASAIHAATGIPQESVEAVARWHGRHAMCVIQTALQDPILRKPIVDGHPQLVPQLVAQAVEAAAYEHAATLADILLRRVPIALDQNWNEDCTLQAAARIAPALYWNERRMKEEIQAFEEERSRFLHKPRNLKPTGIAA